MKKKIANNCKISEITKYGEKMRKNQKNSQKCKKNGQIKIASKLLQKMDTVG